MVLMHICYMSSNIEEKIVPDLEKTLKRANGTEETALQKKARIENIPQEPLGLHKDEEQKGEQNDKISPPTEEDVGISVYIGKHKGFTGTLKERYSDFLVNEVSLTGEVVRLTHFELPKDQAVETDVNDLRNQVGAETVDDLLKLKNGERKEDIKIKVTDMDKNDRKKIHENIRNSFKGLSSSTEEDGQEKVILVSLSKDGRRKRSNWPSLRPDYTHFVLYKENKDTMDAINTIAGILRMKPGAFSYAGTKDKRAKSSQAVSVYRVEGQKLLDINERQKNLTIGNIEYKDKPIGLGDLSGNQFIIILRNVVGSKEDIDSAMNSLKTLGFINYYGMQRFGTTTVPTHHIGRALILNKWKEAVELILKPRLGEDDNTLECRFLWWGTRDAEKAFEKLHKKGSIEGQLLKSLSRQGSNWIGALDGIPRNTRLMYLHSYQSCIWNQVVSRRIEKYGLDVLAGDLILSSTDKSKKATPAIATSEDVQEHRVTIYDVVLPLPGYQISYPDNEVGGWYKEILINDGLELESFRSRIRSYSLGGTYRHLVVRSDNMSWELQHYDDPLQSLVLSDREVLREEQLSSSGTSEPQYLAVKLKICLPPSSYATVAVRELLKTNVTVWDKKYVNTSLTT